MSLALENIPDDLGGPGQGALFRRVFRLWIELRQPDSTPERKWRELLEIFDGHFPDDGPHELEEHVIDWFLKRRAVQRFIQEFG